MSLTLDSLGEAQLLYLKQKWSAELVEINLAKARAADRLEAKLTKRTTNQTEADALLVTLTNAQATLTYLTEQEAPAELIANQQTVVADAQKMYDTLAMGAGTFTDQEAILQQVELDELAFGISYRQQKISDVDALLNP